MIQFSVLKKGSHTGESTVRRLRQVIRSTDPHMREFASEPTDTPPMITPRGRPWCFEYFVDAPEPTEAFQALEAIALKLPSQQLHKVWHDHRSQLQSAFETAYEKHTADSRAYRRLKVTRVATLTDAIIEALAALHHGKVLFKAEVKVITTCYSTWMSQLLANTDVIEQEFVDHADWLNNYVYRIVLRKVEGRKNQRDQSGQRILV